MFPSTWKYVSRSFFSLPFFQTTISIKRDFYLHATRSLINVLAWIYYRRYCCAYFAEDLRARMNARGRSRRARESAAGSSSPSRRIFGKALEIAPRKIEKKKRNYRQRIFVWISKMIKNLIRLDEFFRFGNCSINNRGSWIGKKKSFFFWAS